MICKIKNILKKSLVFPTIFIFLFVASDCYGALEIRNFRYWTAPDHTRIVLDVSDKPDYQIKKTENLFVLNLQDSSVNKNISSTIRLNQPGIKRINFLHVNKKDIQIEFLLDKHQKIEVFKLKKFQDRPDRIVVDIMLEDLSKQEKLQPNISEAKKKRVVIIDPGHGGEDPGAVGKRGTYEKNIVLSISREIRNNINKLAGYRAVLTRDGDYYVSFRKRLQKAKDLQASLFISVHADAARNREAKGSSVYCLSTGAASNEAARLLANNENLSDIFGGDTDIDSNNESNPIIMNMFQTNTINSSKIYAETLIKHLNSVNCLKYEIVQEAPFRVLKLPDIPAVLIETAYISNPQEERLLKKSYFQRSLALVISSSIKDYFAESEKAIPTANEIATTYYKVIKGDTLFSIAGKCNSKVSVLLKLNDMKLEDPIYIGQKIIVPLNRTDLEDEEDINKKKTEKGKKLKNREKPCKLYTVKKGETLLMIAKKNSTSLDELLKINNMKISDKLLQGQKVKIP